jgi:hypothetical protein
VADEHVSPEIVEVVFHRLRRKVLARVATESADLQRLALKTLDELHEAIAADPNLLDTLLRDDIAES